MVLVTFKSDISGPCVDYDYNELAVHRKTGELLKAENGFSKCESENLELENEIDSLEGLINEVKELMEDVTELSRKKRKKMQRRLVKNSQKLDEKRHELFNKSQELLIAQNKVEELQNDILNLKADGKKLKKKIKKKMRALNLDSKISISSAADVHAIAKMRDWVALAPKYKIGKSATTDPIKSIGKAACISGIRVKLSKKTVLEEKSRWS